MSEKVNVCVLCKEQPAAVLCSECCKCYCGECNEYIHKKVSMKEHKTETLFEGVKVNAMCPIHRNNALEMFCVDEVKLCCFGCKTKELHKGHNVVDLSEVNEDNEIFSASDVKTRFADVLKCDDDLERKIEEIIDDIKSGGNVAKEKIKQTFIEAHEKLTKEEVKILEELEKMCNKCEEALQNNLKTLREVREYSSALNEANGKMHNHSSRLMELNVVSEMEKQRKAMDELHRMKMAGLKIGWDNEKRKLSFTRTLFNGAPIPSNISFPVILSGKIEVSWECDGSEVDEENKVKIKYIAEMKKPNEEESGWKEVYSGKDKKCTVTGLEKDIEYNIRVKCVIGKLQGMWSDVASVKTKKLLIDSLILLNEGSTFKEKLSEWCETANFELLYRGTRDGLNADSFHNKCDNKGKTLVLIKNVSGHIFGGFASVPWTNPSSSIGKKAPGSFIFTLTNIHGIEPTKFPLKSRDDGYANYHNKNWGPTFGRSNNYSDIFISSACDKEDCGTGFPGSYNDTTGKGSSIFSSSTSNNVFKVREIEVFRVNV